MGAYDKWGAFSDPFPIHDVTPFANGVLLATDGGLRFRSIYENVVYHSEHGLETSRFYSVVSSNNAVYAVSEYGLIAVFADGSIPWRVINRSYVKNMIGRTRSSKQDYDTAQKKVREYRTASAGSPAPR